ncbi:autotransporter assembly complex family protein, partial [Chromatium okenii]|uniref:autotransporter assembly complex protein TamA n=1 Tax=Chromatium okenii TaxID=61644 RepID=UPI0026E98A5E
VTFKQELLDPALLRRYLNFAPGAIYDPNRLLNLQSRLLGSEYFSAIEIIPDTAHTTPARWVPLTVVATPNLPNQYRLGLGYATDVGSRLRMDWQRRYVNRWGHRLRSTLSLAPSESTLALDYRIPLHDPTRDYLSIKPQLQVADNATGKGWSQTLALAHVSLGANGWLRSFGVDYAYEDLDAASGSLGATNALVPTLSWSKSVTDDPILTQHGYRIKYSLLGGLEGLLAEATYLSGQLQYKWIQGFAQRYRLIVRTDLGVTLTEQVNALPQSRRFYAGGDQSLRGWGFNALGPRASGSTAVSGGRYLAVGSIELERQLAGRWSAALFTDFGNAFDRLNAPAPELSAGFGVRWASPIGQIRFDLAFALSEDAHANGLPPARLHLVIGPDL